MNQAAISRLLIFLVVLLTTGCDDEFHTPPVLSSDGPKLTKEILINNGRYEKPYETLGPIKYTLKKHSSSDTSQIELRNQAIAILKLKALAKYGDKVDAIIYIDIVESTEEELIGKLNVVQIQGIAIAFIPEIKTIPKHKPKNKAKTTTTSPTTTNKIKPAKSEKGEARKTQPKELEITPSELLK